MTESTIPTTADDAIATLDRAAQAAKAGPEHLWPAMNAEPVSWSGTKGYVWADAYGDVKEALRAVWDVCQARGLGIQAALPALFDFPDDHPQAHKGLVLTFPRRATLDEDIADVAAALRTAQYAYGAGKVIQGAERTLSASLSTRFEHFIDMGRDVDKYEHTLLYRPSVPFLKSGVEAAAKALREHMEGLGHE